MSQRKTLCIKCQKVNSCSCGTRKFIMTFHPAWSIPSISRSKKSTWAEFLRRTRDTMKQFYYVNKDKEVRDELLGLYAKYNLLDVFEKADGFSNGYAPQAVKDAKERRMQPATVEVTITDDAMAKLGQGLYMKLRLEMAKNGHDYKALYLLRKSKTESSSIKIYEQLQRKIKKITGYKFEISVTEKRPENNPYGRFGGENEIVTSWTAPIRMPKALRKIPGAKNIVVNKNGMDRIEVGEYDDGD